MNRLDQINGQFPSTKTLISQESIKIDDKVYPEIVDNHPSKGVKLDYFNKQGWGYTDSGFILDKKENAIKIRGTRYMFGG